MRDLIPLIELVKELKGVIPSYDSAPEILFTVFEDTKIYLDLC